MKKTLIILACLTVFACGEKGADPGAVAELYWNALQKGDKAAIEQLVVVVEPAEKPSILSGEMSMDAAKVEEVRFGEAMLEGDKARVPTVVVPRPESQPAGNAIGEISFDTRLVKIDGQWKVDKKTTEANLMGAAFATAMGAMGEAFSAGMKDAVEGIGEAMNEGMQAMVEGLAEGFSEGLDITKSDVTKEGTSEITSAVEQKSYVPPVVLDARVSGTIRGTSVELTSSEWSHNLGIYAGEGWGFNPSLLIFLFLPEGEVPAARTITVKSEDGGYNNPHIHYRWFDPASGDIETEVVTSGYDMVLKLGEAHEQRVSGEIEFSVPGEDTRVAGTFEIKLAE